MRCARSLPPRWNGLIIGPEPPGERSNWSKEAIRAALVVTDRRLGVFARSRPIVNVAFDDARFTYLDLRVEHASLAIEVDASVFNDQASGQITVRLRCADPTAALAAIRTRQARPQDSPG